MCLSINGGALESQEGSANLCSDFILNKMPPTSSLLRRRCGRRSCVMWYEPL